MSSDPRENLLIRFVQPGGGDDLTIPVPDDLRYSVEVPGWFKELSCSLTFPVGVPRPAALAQNAEVQLIDRRNARIIWYGRLDDPGQSSTTPSGTKYALSAKGAQQVVDGFRERYGLVDRASSSWIPVGDFAGGSAGFTGDLSPVDDLTPDDFSGYGDAIDFGGELGIDFGGDLGNLVGDPFGGDLGDWGGIDIGGPLYPKPSSYPGYLGYLKDPSGGPGIQLPIPLGGGGGSFWAGWEEGATGSGGTATGTTTGVLTPGTGPITRHLIGTTGGPRGIGGAMQTPGMFDSGSAYWTTGFTGFEIVSAVDAQFRLLGSASKAQLYFWADPTLLDSGYVVEADTTGVALYQVVGASRTLLASDTSFAPTVGVTYDLSVQWGVNQIEQDTSGGYEVHYWSDNAFGFSSINGFLKDVPGVSTLSTASYTLPDYLDSTNSWVGRYNVLAPDPLQPNFYLLADGHYWGVGAAGGAVEFISTSTS